MIFFTGIFTQQQKCFSTQRALYNRQTPQRNETKHIVQIGSGSRLHIKIYEFSRFLAFFFLLDYIPFVCSKIS